VLLSLFGYGVLIELVQYFLPWRTADFFDVVANTVGLLMAYFAVRMGFVRKEFT
jgi:VanZ family protein